MTKLLRLPEVMEITGLPKSTIYHYIKEGKFPPQIKIGLRSVGWRDDHINKWIDNLSGGQS
jgi:prophage regulatory protein